MLADRAKIFVSYSRRDAGDFAQQIQNHFASFGEYDIFTDVDSIRVGEIWTSTIEGNISNCDVFVVIVTHGALQSPHVEKEVLQAQREKKRIIPCFHRNVSGSDIKWGLDKIQGVEFEDRYDLARNLYSKVSKIASKQREKEPAKETVKATPTKDYPTSSTKKSWKWMAIAGGAVGVILVSMLGTGLLSSIISPSEPTTPTSSPDTQTSTTEVGNESVQEQLSTPAAPSAPLQISPASGTIFNNLPRTTTLEWASVPAAASYTVELDCMSCNNEGEWSSEFTGQPFEIHSGIKGTTYSFDWVGAQPGRWRVWAVDTNGEEGPKSDWWEFSYTQ